MPQLVGAGLVLALCALPARGDENAPPDDVVHLLTAIDTTPTKADLTNVLGPDDQITALRDYALDPGIDFGVRLRAVRALPQFCEGQLAQCRAAILDVLTDLETATNEMPGQRVLRLRAALEALGAIRTGVAADRLRIESYLSNPSRDVRYTAARALRNLCDPASEPALRDHSERVRQVQLAIDEALQALAHCGP